MTKITHLCALPNLKCVFFQLETHVLVLVAVSVAAAAASSASELLYRNTIRDLSDFDQNGPHTVGLALMIRKYLTMIYSSFLNLIISILILKETENISLLVKNTNSLAGIFKS